MGYLQKSIEIFMVAIPFIALFSLLLFLLSLFANRRFFIDSLGKANKVTLIVLFAIFLLALYLRWIPVHRHLVFFDEHSFMAAGKSLLLHHNIGDFHEAIAWPLLISILFKVFGISNYVVLYANSVFGALTVFPVFMVAFQLFKNRMPALVAAFFFALAPKNILWSTTTREDIFSQLIIFTAIYFSLLSFEKFQKSFFWLACIALSFAVQVKLENYSYPIIFIIGFLIYNHSRWRSGLRIVAAPLLFLAVITLPNFISCLNVQTAHNQAAQEATSDQSASTWSLGNLVDNTKEFGPDIFNGKYQPVVYSVLIIAGMFAMAVYNSRGFAFLSIWFVFIITLYFTSWFSEAAGRTRLFMVFDGITILFVSFALYILCMKAKKLIGARYAGSALLILLLVLSVLFIPYIKSFSSYTAYANNILITRMPEEAERDIPPECTVVAVRPLIFTATTDISTVSMERFMTDEEFSDTVINENNCVLLLDDFFCRHWKPELTDICDKIYANYINETEFEYNESDTAFYFSKIISRISSDYDRFYVMKTIPSDGAVVDRNPSSFVFVFNKKVDVRDLKRFSEAFVIDTMSFQFSVEIDDNVVTLKPHCYQAYFEKNREYIFEANSILHSADMIALEPHNLVFRTNDRIDPEGPPEGCAN